MLSGGARRRRALRWTAVGFLLLAGFLAALDVVAVQYVSSRGSTQIVRTMSALEAETDLGGFPFIPRFLRGRLTGVEVHVRGATASGGLRVQAVDVRLPEVRFSPRDAFALSRSIFSTRTEVRAYQPFGTVELAAEDLEEFIRRRVPVVEQVEVTDGAVVVHFDPRVAGLDPDEVADNGEADEEDEEEKEPQFVARFIPRLEDGTFVLILISARLPEPLRQEARRIETLINLPEIPSGLRSSVRLGDGVVVIESEGAEGVEVSVMVGEGDPR